MKTLLRMLPLALVLALGLAAPSPVPAAEPIKIGVILPMTGNAATYGQMAWRGIQLAQEHQPEVLGRPVELKLTDNKSDRVEASNAASRLIKRDEVAAIIGSLSSGTTLAAAPIAEASGVPMVTGWATNPLVTQNKKWIFRTCFIDPFQGGVAARFAYDKLGARTAAVIIDISRDYSVGLAGFFTKTFTQLGGKVVARTMYSQNDQEFSAQLATIQAANPDLIYLPGYLPEHPLVLRQAREMGLSQPFLSGDAAQADEVVAIAGPAVEGLYLTTHFDEKGVTTKAGQRYTTAYRAKYDKAPDAMGALGYDAYMVLVDAIGRAGQAQPDAIRQALDQTESYPGVCGVMTMVERDAVKPAVILQVKDGQFVYVDTVAPK